VGFFGVNRETDKLRIQFLDTDVESIDLANVNWYRERARLVLQDEIDLREQHKKGLLRPTLPYERVAIVYRSLKRNFERGHDFGNAEDCSSGIMEMKRLDPAEAWIYRRVLGLYRFASFYGTSFLRAFLVLLGIPLVAGLLFSIPGFDLGNRPHLTWALKPAAWRLYVSSFMHAFEVATFQREQRYPPANDWSHSLGMLITILVPGQLALFLLALKRRMKR
jgi:hypothetical protein